MSTELIDTAEIARILGVSRAHCVGRLIKRPDFPRPAVNISQRRTRQGHISANPYFSAHSGRRRTVLRRTQAVV